MVGRRRLSVHVPGRGPGVRTLTAAAVLVTALAGPAHAAQPRPSLTLTLRTTDLPAVEEARGVVVALDARRARHVRLKVKVGDAPARTRTVKGTTRRATVRVAAAQLGACTGAIRVEARARGRGARPRTRLRAAQVPCRAPRKAGEYEVGVGVRAIDPEPDGRWKGAPVHLGGYGIGGGRPATGSLGTEVRAFAVSDGTSPYLVGNIEAQGWFAATRDGRGLIDLRRRVARRLQGLGAEVSAQQVHVQANHSHAGIDALGVWGGIPPGYADFVLQQAEDALVEAWLTRRAGRLHYGVADGTDLLSNQFGYDREHGNDVLDSEVRVLQARDRRGKAFATLLNFSAHSTVLGSDNTKASGDWPWRANQLLEEAFGGRAMTMIGTFGRTQPRQRGDDGCPKEGDAKQRCKLDTYASLVVARAQQAAQDARPLGGETTVRSASYLVLDPATNAVILGLEVGGAPLGIPFNRALTAPWQVGNTIGTVVSSARIGDVLLSGGPGEMYPQIPLAVRAQVQGLRGYLTAGLMNDQLGYLIAPFEAYPEPIERSLFSRDPLEEGDSLPIEPISNDNYFFNVSHTMGERITCALLRGAGLLFDRGDGGRGAHPRCALFANDLALAPGDDDRLSR